MFEKDMAMTVLLDYYGDLLGEHRRGIIELYYNEDYSLSEIAEISGISRQGVRDSIKKSENELRKFESCLHLVRRNSVFNEKKKIILDILEEKYQDASLKSEIIKLIEDLQF